MHKLYREFRKNPRNTQGPRLVNELENARNAGAFLKFSALSPYSQEAQTGSADPRKLTADPAEDIR